MTAKKKNSPEGLFIPSAWVWRIIIFVITVAIPMLGGMFVSHKLAPVNGEIKHAVMQISEMTVTVDRLEKKQHALELRISSLEVHSKK